MELFNKAASTVSMAAFLLSSDLLGALSSVGVSVPYRSEYNGFLCLGADLAAECFVKVIHSVLRVVGVTYCCFGESEGIQKASHLLSSIFRLLHLEQEQLGRAFIM